MKSLLQRKMLYKIFFAFCVLCWTSCDSCQIALGEEYRWVESNKTNPNSCIMKKQTLMTSKPPKLDCRRLIGSSKRDECWAQFDDELDNLETEIEWLHTEQLKEKSDNVENDTEEYIDQLMLEWENFPNDIKDDTKKLIHKSDNLEKHIKHYLGESYFQGGNSKTSIYIGGLHIVSELPVSFATSDEVVLSLTGPLDEINYRVNRQEIKLQLRIGGKIKKANIKIPATANIMEHVKIETLSDVIRISGLDRDQSFVTNLFRNVYHYLKR